MDFSFLSELNYLAILVSALAYWVLGALWYSPVLFGKIWGKIVQPSDEAKKKMGPSMALSFLGILVICFALALFVRHLAPPDMIRGVKIALVAGIAFTLLPMWINHLYQQNSFTVLVIDGLYHIAGFVVAAIILTSWL